MNAAMAASFFRSPVILSLVFPSIPLFGEFGLANQIGTVEYSRPRRFRGMLEQWLGTIRVIWPECPARISSDGQSIKIAPATSIVPAEARYA